MSRFFPIVMLVFYTSTQALAGKGTILASSVVSAIFPSISHDVENVSVNEWRKRYAVAQDICLVTSGCLLAAIYFFGTDLLTGIFSAEIALQMKYPLFILCVGAFFHASLYVPSWVAIAMKKTDMLVKANCVSMVIVFPLLWFLASKFGILGLSTITLLFICVQYVFFIPRFAAECIQSSACLWYRHAFALAMSAGVTYGSFYALSTFFPGIAIRVAFYCAGTAAFLVISSQLVSVRLADVLRELITNAFSKILPYRNIV